MPPTPSPFIELLADLRSAFQELGLRWYVFGAQAALLYGSPRLTADVDVTVALGSLAPERLVQALRAHRFVPRFADADFVQRTRVLPVVHEPTELPTDIVFAGPGLEEMFLERAELHDLGGLSVPVATAEDIVVMKVLAGRDKDKADIEAILAAQDKKLDHEKVRETLSLVESALDQSDLLPIFEAALARVKR